MGTDTMWLTNYNIATDTIAYADTLWEKDEFKAEIFDTFFNNRIIGRSLRWANIAPVEVKTVTNSLVKKDALIKVFVGADVSGGKSGIKYNLDLAPGASLVLADRYMLDIGYYIFNQQVSIGFKVKLSFKR